MTATTSTVSGPVLLDAERPARSDTSEAAARHHAAAPPAPARAAGVELLGDVAGSGYRRQPALVRRADGQTIQLTPLLFRLLQAIDGERDHDELAAAVGEQVGRSVTADDVRFLVESKLRPLGVLRQPDGAEPAVAKTNPLLALRLKLLVSNPETTRRITLPFTAFFRPSVVAAFVTAFALTAWWVVFEKGLASAAHQAIYEPTFLLLVFALTLLSAAFHEIGHAAACRYSGARPGGMGVGLYLVWPAFYTDVTDSYRLARRDRLRVDLGGLYFNAIFAVAVVGVWAAVGWDALLLVVAAQLIQMARQLVPIVRFDGYHVLADLVGVPDLFAHIKPTLLGLLPTRWGRAEGKVLKRWARAVVTLWVIVVVPLLATLLALLVVVLPRLVATAWDSLGLHWADVQTSWHAAEASAVAVGLLSMLMICLPLVGIPYLLGRVVRRTAQGAWRATAGRPPLRIGAACIGIALTGAVAWSWWPDGQYRPIEAGRKSQLTETPRPTSEPRREAPVPVAQAIPVVRAPAPAPTPTAVAPSAPVEERPRAQWAVVLVPHGSADTTEVAIGTATVPTGELPGPGEETDPPIAPTEPEPAPAPPEPGEEPAQTPAPSQPAEASRPEWPFPFEPPREPEEGDNQALAVNTEDGSTKVDVALALVWVTDGSPVEQRNEAYALASCRDCRTVAIAFQVVFVIGYAQVVTPINAAVALNYACEACTTHALAVQLVATLTREPSPETLGELAEIWSQLEADSESFALLPIDQVYEDLLETRTRVLEVIAGEGAQSPTETEPEPEAVEPVTGADAADVADATPPATTDDAEPSPEEPTTTPEPPPADAEPGAAEADAATESSQEAPSTTDGTTTSSESTSTTDEQAGSPPPPAETTTDPSETEAPPTTP